MGEWCKFSAWVFAVEGSNFPSHLGLLLNYIEKLAQEPCAKTRLQAVLSREWEERPESAISSEVLVRNLVSAHSRVGGRSQVGSCFGSYHRHGLGVCGGR